MATTANQTIPPEERQVNLLLALRHTVGGLTVHQILDSVAGYDPDGGQSARRMFERDKEILRGLGVPVESHGTGEDVRYYVDESVYALPAIRLDAPTAAAIDLAASAWRDGSLPTTARRALGKLKAVSSSGTDQGLVPDLTIDLAGREVPPELAAAVDERRPVRFTYTSARSGTRRQRTVAPCALRLSEGAWYLDGRDLDSGQERTFRLARVSGDIQVLAGPGSSAEPPADDNAAQAGAAQAGHQAAADTMGPRARTALLAVLPGCALELRLRSREPDARRRVGRVGRDPGPTAPAGRDLLQVDYEDPFSFAGSLAALGQCVVVIEPACLRELVRDHLRGAAALDGGER